MIGSLHPEDAAFKISSQIDDYGKKHLIAHLVDLGDWEKIEELIDDPLWGVEAKKALGRHNSSRRK